MGSTGLGSDMLSWNGRDWNGLSWAGLGGFGHGVFLLFSVGLGRVWLESAGQSSGQLGSAQLCLARAGWF